MKRNLIHPAAKIWRSLFLFVAASVTTAFGQDANLIYTYQQGSILSGNTPAGDSVTVNIWVATDADTPSGSHTISYTGGITHPNKVVTVGSGGITPGQTALVDTISIGAYNPGPIDGWPSADNPPSWYSVGLPFTNTVNGNALMDYDSTTMSASDEATITVNSIWKWTDNLYPADGTPDTILGYEDAYWKPKRDAKSTTLNITLHLWGPLHMAQNQPYFCTFCKTCKNMAVASLDRFQAGVAISDAPIGYTPPVGASMNFQVTYHQRLSNQPTTFNFSNLGPQWSFNWLSYISGGPTNNEYQATYYAPGGSQYTFGGYLESPSTPSQGDFQDNEGWTLSTLHYRQSPERYERWLPDGTVEVFGQAVGGSPNRLFFLTSITDPQNNVTTLSYDQSAAQNGNARLLSVTDPFGKQLVFGYGSSDPLKITRVTRTTDGLSANLQYNGNGQLSSSADPLGITSSFQYASGTNFINSMTTPYGTSTFSSTDGSGFLEADITNPLGQTERVEYQESLSSWTPSGDTSIPSVTGLSSSTVDNSNLNQHSTYYWSRREYADGVAAGGVGSTGFYNKAEVTHWAENGHGSIPVPLAKKMPLESGWFWYTYPSQIDKDTVQVWGSGAMVQPSITARLVNSGSGTAAQATFASYNSNGMLTQSIDPIGRTTNYSYYSNNIDPYQIKQTSGGATGGDLLSSMTYNSQHEPLTITDAAGQTTTLTYNGLGQLLTRTVVVGGSNQTTSLNYNSNGYLSEVTGPVSGATTSYTYDASGRQLSVTDSEGYTVTTEYDNLDRPTQTTYPDGTTDRTVYQNLDVAQSVDRQGRVTSNQYDAIRELLQTTDPLGRTTKYAWCTCGGLSQLTDPNGNVTNWGLDTEGRVTSKTYADSTGISYTYQAYSSRLSSMTDAKGSTATYGYNADDTLSGVTYSPATSVAATPSVGFSYDSVYNRVTAMTDGIGTTSYSYNPINGLVGAGRLSSVAVPMVSTGTATVTYSYDELGRVLTRDVDQGTTNANNVSTTYDALGRVTNVSNALGAFSYGYINTTNRLAQVDYPNWQVTTYSYLGNTGDQRLQEINNYVWGFFSNTHLSKFDYTYNPVGTIATWQQQQGTSTPTLYTLGYDAADQLTSAVQSGGATGSDAYRYDPAGNRLTETTTTGTTTGNFNKLNQLMSVTGTGTLQTVSGYTSAAVTNVTVNAVPATISSTTNFTANVSLTPGSTNMISVVAQPSSSTGTITTQRWNVVTSGTAPTALTYDANGNCTQDENGNTYTWDALNRLVGIAYHSGTYSGTHTEFTYDGLSRRVQIVEKSGTTYGSGTASSTKNYLWIGSEIAEERNASNTVTKRFFPQGEQQSGTNYYYTSDHLGSTREMVNSSGTIVARYAYDAYGNTTLVSGSDIATFQYGGMMKHPASGLYLTLCRIYDALTGLWHSRDPMGEGSDATLYSYVGNNPISFVDPSGLYFVLPKDPAERQQVTDALNALSEADRAYYHSRGELPGVDSLSAMLLALEKSPYPIAISINHIVGDQESPGNCPGSSNVAWNPDWDPNDPNLVLSLLAHELQHAWDESIYPKNQINPNDYNPNDAPPWEQRAVRRQNQAIRDLNAANGGNTPILTHYPSGRNPPVPYPTGSPLDK